MGEALVIAVILAPLVLPKVMVALVPPRWSRLASRIGIAVTVLVLGTLGVTGYQLVRDAEAGRVTLLLFLLAVFFLLGLLFAFQRVLGRWTMRRIEDRHLRRHGVACPPLPVEPPTALPFLRVGVAQLGAVLLLIVLRLPLLPTLAAACGLMALCFLAGNYLHYVPNSSRRRKYQLLLAGALLFWLCLPLMEAHSAVPFGAPRQPPAMQLVMQPAILFVLFVLAAPFVQPAPRPPGRLTRLFWRTEWFWLLLPAFYLVPGPLPPVLLLQLLVRHAVGEALARAPILYLRSFGHAGAPTAFARIVAPVARPRGVVVALAHQRQRPSDFFSAGDPTEIAARFAMVPDAEWQAWVTAHLRAASVVVFDHSVDTEAVRWEREQATALVPAERVVVLYHRDGPPPSPAGAGLLLPYTSSRLGAWRVRWRLRGFLRRALSAWDREVARRAPPLAPVPAPPLAPVPAPPAPVVARGQLPGSPCALCAGKLISILDGAFCPSCGRAVHHRCRAAHDEDHPGKV